MRWVKTTTDGWSGNRWTKSTTRAGTPIMKTYPPKEKREIIWVLDGVIESHPDWNFAFIEKVDGKYVVNVWTPEPGETYMYGGWVRHEVFETEEEAKKSAEMRVMIEMI